MDTAADNITTYEVTTADGWSYLVDAVNEQQAARVASRRLSDLPANQAQRLTIRPVMGSGIEWHRD